MKNTKADGIQIRSLNGILWLTVGVLALTVFGTLLSVGDKASAQGFGTPTGVGPSPTLGSGVLTPMSLIEATPDATPAAVPHTSSPGEGINALDMASWQLQAPPSSPSARAGMGFVYDSFRNVIVATGGYYGSTGFYETWEYDGTTWTRRFFPQFPGGRQNPAIAYDPKRRVTVFFGGSTPDHTAFFNDTWEYDGTNWFQRFPLNPPSPRNGARMAYDPIRGVMLLFGGYRWEGRMVFFDETWEYDGSQWIQRFPANHPEPRETPGLAYDSARGVMVLFGGGRVAGSVVFNDTWEWDGNNWTQRMLPTSPPARWVHAMTYDQGRNRTILFGGLTGGTTEFNDTWEYDGYTWTQIVTSPSPPERWDHGMVYDAARDTTVLFGGQYYQNGSRWRNDTWTYTAPLAVPERPVVLLPGFGGSTLRGHVAPGCIGLDIEVWLNLAQLIADPWDNHLRRLELSRYDGYSPENDCNIIEPSSVIEKIKIPLADFVWEEDQYEELYINLRDHGYEVELCPYDWRRSIHGYRDDDLPQRVDECVEAARQKYDANQVDIVAHSMGGLAARQYVLSSSDRAGRVHTIVSLGTPYLGTPKSLLPLRYGKTSIDQLDLIANDDRVREIARNWPSPYQLLPSQKLFQQGLGSYFWSDGRWYSSYDSMRTFLEVNYNDTLVDLAHDFHSDAIDDWRNDGLGVDYYIFVGTGIDTPRWIIERTVQQWGEPPRLDYYMIDLWAGGDGTVLTQSADLTGSLGNLSGDATACYYLGVKHAGNGSLTNNPFVWNDIDKALRGLPLATDPDGHCQLPAQSSFKSSVQALNSQTSDSRQLIVDGQGLIHVWDELGRHTGPLSNGLIESNIPLVTYQTGDGKTFVSLPPVSTYTITVQMIDAGPMKLRFLTIVPADIPEEAISQTVIFQNIPTAIGGQATITYNPLADPNTLSVDVDLDGDGTTDITLPPTAILDSQQSADHEPPVSSILIQGQTDSWGFFTGPVMVTLQATDTGTGVYQIEYSLDGGLTGQVYTGPFTVIAEDVPVLYAQATDRAGNTEYPWAEKRLRPHDLYLPIILK